MSVTRRLRSHDEQKLALPTVEGGLYIICDDIPTFTNSPSTQHAAEISMAELHVAHAFGSPFVDVSNDLEINDPSSSFGPSGLRCFI